MNNNNLQLILDGINFLKVQNQEILKRLDSVEARLDKVEARLDAIEVRLDKIEARLDKVESRLDKVEAQLGKVENKLKELELRLHKVEIVLSGVRCELLDHRLKLDSFVTEKDFAEFRSLNLKFHDDTKGALVRLEQEMKILVENNKNTVERIVVLEKA